MSARCVALRTNLKTIKFNICYLYRFFINLGIAYSFNDLKSNFINFCFIAATKTVELTAAGFPSGRVT